MLVQAVISGVDGAIGSTYNVNVARQIYDLAREGKVEEAYKIQHDTNNIIETVLSMGIYPTLKEILKHEASMVEYLNVHFHHLMKQIVKN